MVSSPPLSPRPPRLNIKAKVNQCSVHVDAENLFDDAGDDGCVSNVGSNSNHRRHYPPSPPELIGSIDQGTSSTRFILFNRRGRIAASAQVEFEQIFPPGAEQVGWHEHDPLELIATVRQCVESLAFELRASHGVDLLSASTAASCRCLTAVGITNQRETTLAWNAKTGRCYYNAIVWDDTRTVGVAHEIAANGGDANDRLRDRTGVPIAGSYLAGTKVRWLLDHVPELAADLANPDERKYVRFGTVDTWIAYQLTGSPAAASPSNHGVAASSIGAANSAITEGNTGGVFVTDVTNASRWLFMDLRTLKWDPALIAEVCGRDRPHSVPMSALPSILPSSGYFGTISPHCGVPSLANVPIAAMMGDQQSALFGQCAFGEGEAKCTYGTGLFVMMGTGTQLVRSTHGLIGTVGYQLGPKLTSPSSVRRGGDDSGSGSGSGSHNVDQSSSPPPEISGAEPPDGDSSKQDNQYSSSSGGNNGGKEECSNTAAAGPVHYALEGSVSHSGSTIQWLRDRLQIITSASDSEALATQISSNDGLYFVPAFAGLFAPHWRDDARGVICGMTASHTKCHVVRASLEACAYQAREILECLQTDTGAEIRELRVDGGMVSNEFLMQFQADILGERAVDVVRPVVSETTALGAAFAAGLAAGVWRDLDELRGLWREERRWSSSAAMSDEERARNWTGWGKAVERSLGWAAAVEDDTTTTEEVVEEEEEEERGATIDDREATNDEGDEEDDKRATLALTPTAAPSSSLAAPAASDTQPAQSRGAPGSGGSSAPLLLGAAAAVGLAAGYVLGRASGPSRRR